MLASAEINHRVSRHLGFLGKSSYAKGALIAVSAPRNNVDSPPIPASLKEKWLDVPFRLKSAEYQLNSTFYGGDAVPNVFVDYGPGALFAFGGGECRFDNDTIWFDENPLFDSLDEVKNFSIKTDGEFYRSFKELTLRLCENSRGRYIVGIADFGTNLDTLATLYPREKLLRDILKRPQEVQDALAYIHTLWQQMVEQNFAMIHQYSQLSTSWIPIVNDKKFYPLLSEFSTMISSKLFEKIVFPALEREAASIDDAIYNIDGEQAVKNLSGVLQLKNLRAIQWDPVPKYSHQKKGVFKDFTSEISIDVCRKIQNANCKLILNGILPEDVDSVLSQISPDGVFINTQCKNETEAKEFLESTKKWVKQESVHGLKNKRGTGQEFKNDKM